MQFQISASHKLCGLARTADRSVLISGTGQPIWSKTRNGLFGTDQSVWTNPMSGSERHRIKKIGNLFHPIQTSDRTDFGRNILDRIGFGSKPFELDRIRILLCLENRSKRFFM